MDHQFKRLLNLVRRTGDRLVVTDPNGEDTYVLMGLEAYEKLADNSVLPETDFSDCFDCGDEFNKYDNEDDDDEDDEYDEKINDFDPNWKIPDEFFTGTVGANGHSPELNHSPEPNLEPNHSPTTPDSPILTPSIQPEPKTNTPPSNIWSVLPPAGDNSQTWNPQNFGEAEIKTFNQRSKTPSQTPSGVVEEPKVEPQPSPTSPQPSPTPSGVEEPTPKPTPTDDLGEEQFYLEPVE